MPPPDTIRILTADDHPMIRSGLAAMLARESDMQVVAEAGDGEQAIEAYARHLPDIVLLDVAMPVMDGETATRAILAEYPDARIVMLTTYAGDEHIHRALAAGARSYLLKDMLRTELLTVVREVMRGTRRLPPSINATLAEYGPRTALTPRESEVLQFMSAGKTNREIAALIGRAESTIKVHLGNILMKLNATDRTEAVTTALRRGFLRLP